MAIRFGAAYTLAVPNPDGSDDFLPTTQPLTPFKAAQVLSPGEKSGIYQDAGGYSVLTTGDEYRTLKLQKCVADFAKAAGMDDYIQQAAAANLASLKTAMTINAGFVDTSEIERNPQWFPTDQARLPANSSISLENEPAGNEAGTSGIPTLSDVAQALHSVVAPDPGTLFAPPSTASPHILLSQGMPAPQTGVIPTSPAATPGTVTPTVGPLSPLLQNGALTQMAQTLAADIAKSIAGQLGDDTIVKAKISVSQTLPADQAPAALGQLAAGTPGGNDPMISLNPDFNRTVITDKTVGLPPIRPQSLATPWPLTAAANPFTQAAVTEPLIKPSANAQF